VHKVATDVPPDAFTAWLIARFYHDEASDILNKQATRRG
jgi:hypothetical protein